MQPAPTTAFDVPCWSKSKVHPDHHAPERKHVNALLDEPGINSSWWPVPCGTCFHRLHKGPGHACHNARALSVRASQTLLLARGIFFRRPARLVGRRIAKRDR
jgi:hypothetical protein